MGFALAHLGEHYALDTFVGARVAALAIRLVVSSAGRLGLAARPSSASISKRRLTRPA